LVLLWLFWWIDPDSSRDVGRFGWLADEAFMRAWDRKFDGFLAGGMDCPGLSEGDRVGGHRPGTGWMVIGVIPGKKPAAKGAGSAMVTNRPGNSG